MTEGKISTPTDTGADHRGAGAPEQGASKNVDPVERIVAADAEGGDEDAASLEALPFSAPSLKRKQPVLDLPADEDDDLEGEMPDFSIPRRVPVMEVEPEAAECAQEIAPKLSVVAPDHSPPAKTLDAPVDDRSLEDLGLVQLAARLGASLERRRARQRDAKLESAQTPSPALAETTEAFDAAAADEAARARAEFFGGSERGNEQQPASANEPEAAPASEPASHARFDFIDGEELTNSFSLTRSSTRVAAWQPPTTSYDDEGLEDEDGDEDEYSSLLALRNPFERKQPAFVRVEEPEPVEDEFETSVSFPQKKNAEPVEHPESAGTRQFDPPQDSQTRAAPHLSGDAERDLRAALETLQRTSNAG